ncbi:hypothetical protein [Streptomyces sp. NPDC001070]
MSDVWRRLVRAFRAVDRFLGGERPPTRTQRFAARHPLGVALGAGAIGAAYFLLLADVRPPDRLLAGASGFLLGGILGATALYERRRQRRLLRLGLWDGR